jgi:hypothetical protein
VYGHPHSLALYKARLLVLEGECVWVGREEVRVAQNRRIHQHAAKHREQHGLQHDLDADAGASATVGMHTRYSHSHTRHRHRHTYHVAVQQHNRQTCVSGNPPPSVCTSVSVYTHHCASLSLCLALWAYPSAEGPGGDGPKPVTINTAVIK